MSREKASKEGPGEGRPHGHERHLQEFARAKEPKPGATERLLARQSWSGRLLKGAAKEPKAGAMGRLLRRVSRGRRGLPWWWLLAPAMASAGGAAAAWWAFGDVGERAEEELREEAVFSGRLQAEVPTVQGLSTGLTATYAGSGEVRGDSGGIRVFWEVGSLRVEVGGRAGGGQGGGPRRVVVETSEGEVEALPEPGGAGDGATGAGTTFTVTRGPLGTGVEVPTGTVSLRCLGAEEERLGTGGPSHQGLCLPTRPAGMLGRARALRAEGAPTAVVLAAVERGLGMARPGDPALGELTALHLDILITGRRYAEALVAAERYLESGDPARREEVEGIVEELRARGL